jgi:hypothetical protein
MPSNAQRSHAGKKAPNMSKVGAPASEQPHRDSNGGVRTQALTGCRLIPCFAQYESRAVQHGSALHQNSLATVIRTLRRAAMSHILCDRRRNDVRIASLHGRGIGCLSKAAVIVAVPAAPIRVRGPPAFEPTAGMMSTGSRYDYDAGGRGPSEIRSELRCPER